MTQPERLADTHPVLANNANKNRSRNRYWQSITAATCSSDTVVGNDRRSGTRTARPRARLRAIPCRNGL